MNTYSSLLVNSAAQYNIIPLTSRCNRYCIFCSHFGNPAGAEVSSIPDLDLEGARELLDYLDPDSKIVVGESASRLIEGEPTLNPSFCEIVKLIRIRFPNTPLQITTNGSNIDQKMSSFLESISPVEIFVSVSSFCKDENIESAFSKNLRVLELLSGERVPFSVSFVPLPFLTGWDFVKKALEELVKFGPQLIRILPPGFTRVSPFEIRYDFLKFPRRLSALIEEIDVEKTPIMIEPGGVESLEAVVEGVVPGGPADRAGIQKGDVIEKVEGKRIFSRVDAFNKIHATCDPEVEFRRNKAAQGCLLNKPANYSPGTVFKLDFDPARIRNIERLITASAENGIWMLASQAGCTRLQLSLEKAGLHEKIEIFQVKSYFWGGSIRCSGLLTVYDFSTALEEICSAEKGKPNLLVIPEEAFDFRGRDIVGEHYLRLKEDIDVPIFCA